MNRQGLLDHFVKTVNGKGRSHQNKFCRYVNEGHPGCAIGCQPKFQKWRKDNQIESDQIEGKSISHLIRDFPTLELVFGVEVDKDREFLNRLQYLHDCVQNWNGNDLVPLAVSNFCNDWMLRNPLENSNEC